MDINSKILLSGDVRIMRELAIASQKIGFLQVEHAFWILIPRHEVQTIANVPPKVSWISAVGQDGGLSSRVRLPLMVAYSPSQSEVKELLATARNCDWVLHVHNHPREPYPGAIISPDPSRNDFSFAYSWKTKLAEVAHKMRFFVVQQHTVNEYASN